MKTYIEADEKSSLRTWIQQFGSRFETGFIVTDPSEDDAPIIFVNDAFTDITGYTFKEVRGKNLRFLQGEETDMNLIKKIDHQLSLGQPVNAELLNYKKDGTPFWNELVIQPLVSSGGDILYTMSFILDITERKKDESLLKLQEKIFTGINEGEELHSLLQRICKVVESFFPSGAACCILLKDQQDQWTIGAADSIPDEIASQVIPNFIKSIDEGASELTCKDFDCDCPPEFYANTGYQGCRTVPINDSEGNLYGLIKVLMKSSTKPTPKEIQYLDRLAPLIQMTKKYYEQQEQYRWLAYSDPDTGLPNRHAFIKKLEGNLKDNGEHFIAVIEPTELTSIVDLYGRSVADDLFIQLAKRIKSADTEKEHFIGRFSSSSLVMTNSFVKNKDGKYYLFQLRDIVSEPFIVAGQEILLTMKIGVSLTEKVKCPADELLRRADVALTESKRRTGNAMSFYKDLQNEEMIQELTLFSELSKALTNNELDVHFQPKVDLKTAKIIGFEALARWHSPVLGHVPPNVFIPAAENSGKIIELEKGVLTKVMKWLEQRAQIGADLYQVAVNISVNHFFDPSFVSMLKKLTKKHQVDPEFLQLELTESIGLVDFKSAKKIFDALCEAGFTVSVDDFGVGFSSLSYLSQLKVSELKIDRSFVSSLDEADTSAVVMTIIQLANNLNLSTVAEGIEEERHVEMLLQLGCQIGQGFYFYKPMPLEEIDELLENE